MACSTHWPGKWGVYERLSPTSHLPPPTSHLPPPSHLVRLLLVNWQDIENPQAGGAEIHLHEIFGRLARRGHAVTLLCGGRPGCPPRVTIDGMDVHRVGTRQSFGALAYPYFRRELLAKPRELLIEDVNKVP